jgi:hypothetical protein
VGSFPEFFLPKPCIRLSPPHPIYMPHPANSPWYYHPHKCRWGVQIIKLLIMKFSLCPCYFVLLRPKYSPQHPILKHLQPTFLPQCQRKSFSPILNVRCRKNLQCGCFYFMSCCISFHVDLGWAKPITLTLRSYQF